MSLSIRKEKKWLLWFVGFLIFYVVIAFFSECLTPKADSIFFPLLSNFGGNLMAGVLSGVLFLFLGLYLSSDTEAKIEKIIEVTNESEKKLAERERLLKQEQKIFKFKHFSENESYHNVMFPDIKTSEDKAGLEYTIYPLRDSQTQEPIKKSSEMYEYSLVKVKGPSYLSPSKPELWKMYEESPIRDGQYYFCSFFNDSWNMTSGDFDDKWYRFYFSSKMGHIEHGESANEFMHKKSDPFTGLTKVGQIQLGPEYQELGENHLGSFYTVDILQDASAGVFIKLEDSGPLHVYSTTKRQEVPEQNWQMVIYPIRGFASGIKLKNLKNAIEKFIFEKNMTIQKISWYRLPDERQLID